MANDSTDSNSANIDGQIAYHKEMEEIANRAGDFTKADHHRKMQEIYKAMKESNVEVRHVKASDIDVFDHVWIILEDYKEIHIAVRPVVASNSRVVYACGNHAAVLCNFANAFLDNIKFVWSNTRHSWFFSF